MTGDLQSRDTPFEDADRAKSLKLWWNAETVGKGDILGFLFGERKETIQAAELLFEKMRQDRNLSITRGQLRRFAVDLSSGHYGFKYGYHNFYMQFVRKLVSLGLLEKCMIWDPNRGTTVRVYRLRIQQIPTRSPPSGFVKQVWQIAKSWNDYISSGNRR